MRYYLSIDIILSAGDRAALNEAGDGWSETKSLFSGDTCFIIHNLWIFPSSPPNPHLHNNLRWVSPRVSSPQKHWKEEEEWGRIAKEGDVNDSLVN